MGNKATVAIHRCRARIALFLYGVAEPSHAALVLFNQGLAVGGWVVGLGEEHALVALRLFFLAHTARLGFDHGQPKSFFSNSINRFQVGSADATHLGL
jgi:hypothetical protein